MDFTFDDVQRDLQDLARKILGEQVTAERLLELEDASEPFDRFPRLLAAAATG